MERKDKNVSNNDSVLGLPKERIGRLEERTMGYYRRVEDKMKAGFDEHDEDKGLFLDNVFGELKKEAIRVSQNQTVSRIVEHLLQEANVYQLVEFTNAISKDWELVCTDRFITHVTETTLQRLGVLILTEANTEVSTSILAEAFDHFLELYGFLMSNLAFHMQHTYTSHIVRSMIEVLGGVQVKDNVRGSQHKAPKEQQQQFPEPDQRFLNLLGALCDKLMNLPKLEDHLVNPLSSPVIQTALVVLHKREPERCQKLCRSLAASVDILEPSETCDEDEAKIIPEIIQHNVGNHIVEVLLRVGDVTLFDRILSHLKPILLAVALHPVAYFIAGTLIKMSHTKEQFETIFKSLSHHIEDLLGLNHAKLVIDLAEGCIKHGTKQDRLVKALMKAFHCFDPPERQVKCVPLFASLITYESFYKLPSKKSDETEISDEDSSSEDEVEIPKLSAVSLQGSLLLQQLLRFGNPKLILTSLLHLSAAEILTLSCDRFGNHVMEVFMSCDTVGEKTREVLYSKLKGLYMELACDKHGSRSLDALLVNASMKHRTTITEELSKHASKLQSHMFGRFACYKLNISLFLRDRNQWRAFQQKESGKRKIMQELIEGEGKNKKKKLQNTERTDETESLVLEKKDKTDFQEASTKEEKGCKSKKWKKNQSLAKTKAEEKSDHTDYRHNTATTLIKNSKKKKHKRKGSPK